MLRVSFKYFKLQLDLFCGYDDVNALVMRMTND